MYRKTAVNIALSLFLTIPIISISSCSKEPPPIEVTVKVYVGSSGTETTVDIAEWQPKKLYKEQKADYYIVYLLDAGTASECSDLTEDQFDRCQISITRSKNTTIHDLGFQIQNDVNYCIYYAAVDEDGSQFDISYHTMPVSFPYHQEIRNISDISDLIDDAFLGKEVRVSGSARYARISDGYPPKNKTDWILEGPTGKIYVSNLYDTELFEVRSIIVVGTVKKSVTKQYYLEGFGWRGD